MLWPCSEIDNFHLFLKKKQIGKTGKVYVFGKLIMCSLAIDLFILVLVPFIVYILITKRRKYLTKLKKMIIVGVAFSIAILIEISFISLKSYNEEFYFNLRGSINTILGCDSTCFSSEFTDDKFDKIKIGMSQDKVMEILGSPLSTKVYGPKKEYHWYTKSCDDGDYHHRSLIYDVESKNVIKKNQYYYFE